MYSFGQLPYGEMSGGEVSWSLNVIARQVPWLPSREKGVSTIDIVLVGLQNAVTNEAVF